MQYWHEFMVWPTFTRMFCVCYISSLAVVIYHHLTTEVGHCVCVSLWYNNMVLVSITHLFDHVTTEEEKKQNNHTS